MENTKGSRLFVRIPAYVIGLLIMTLGVAISVKSNLGVSPVSSIPYTITCVVGLEMGKATILFHAVLVLLQILLLRRAFQAKNLLQIFAGILFGYFTPFTTFCMVLYPKVLSIKKCYFKQSALYSKFPAFKPFFYIFYKVFFTY